MQFITLPLYYFLWHYTHAFRGIVTVWFNFLWFFYNFFSVGLLFKTFFSPWHRISEPYRPHSGAINIIDVASALLVNITMRIIGAMVRFFVICIGLFVLMFVFVSGVLFFIFWIFVPFIITLLLFISVAIFVSL